MQVHSRMRHWWPIVTLLAACDPQVPPDAGTPGDDAALEATVVRVSLGTSNEGELPSEWSVVRMQLVVDEVRVNNDRGGAMEPSWAPSGALALSEMEIETELEGPPATYGGLTLRGDARVGALLEVELDVGGDERLELTSTRPYDIALRCDGGPVRLGAADQLRLRARFQVSVLANALDGESLPDAEDGVIHIDDDRAPDAAAAAEAALLAAWTLDCELSEASTD